MPVVGVTVEGDLLSRAMVEVRHTGSVARGLGVYALELLPANTWVGDYVGEVLTQKQYLKRYPREDARYVLGANEDYNVDAADAQKSSYLRYLNHAPSVLPASGDTGHDQQQVANVFFEVVKVRKQREKQLKFYTSREVAAGEELVFDYGKTYWSERSGERE